MNVILTPQESRELDMYAATTLGISDAQLMATASYNASRKCLELIQNTGLIRPNISICCGNGNNGGDGFSIAVLLSEIANVTVIHVAKPEKMSTATRTNYHHALTTVECLEWPDNLAQERLISADCIIDALIGIGCYQPPNQLLSSLINSMQGALAQLKIAIDVPTGCNALTGECYQPTFQATHTVTMAATKIGLLRNNAPDYTGNIHVASIGVLPQNIQTAATIEDITVADWLSVQPSRKMVSSKFSYGHTVVIGGSVGMLGAPCMSAHAALRMGSGLVTLCSPGIHTAAWPELLTQSLRSTSEGTIAKEELKRLQKICNRATAVAIGPGCGASLETIEMLAVLITELKPEIPVVLDAEALFVLERLDEFPTNLVITPHAGELSRVLGVNRSEVEFSHIELARDFARKHNCVVHSKVVPACTTNGVQTTVCTSGTPALATAGSGDVLTGVIASLAAQGMGVYDATRYGAFIHAMAGRYASEQRVTGHIIASDIIHSLGMMDVH